ncbi:hypothetical protein B9Z19DRAFT_1123665 [Tuber borchii]|uniref:Uncharacterized protein n=1 Tax=Tuber borchii TaxID=42251 RepID=A0A2T6ZY34_TUBBO|nr:hypothetical protein B9Z19DRAFT_1123665 [Tuber borchii]
MPAESLLPVAIYRGLTMLVAIERNTEGRSNNSMIAYVVNNIADRTTRFLQVVNYTFIYRKYLYADDLHSLSFPADVPNFFKVQKIYIQPLVAEVSLEDV